MNNCILMAQIIQEPQLRYTSDNLALAEMLVEFTSYRQNDPPAHLKVIGWGNFAQELHSQYHVGDRVVIEGRLSMNTVERPEGFKEKRAELVAQRIHSLGEQTEGASSQGKATPATNVVALESRRSTASAAHTPIPSEPTGASRVSPPPAKTYYQETPVDDPEDEIPF
ncbi:MAG: single-stranded DNA-binding protein [Chroococcales cyanobacterium]